MGTKNIPPKTRAIETRTIPLNNYPLHVDAAQRTVLESIKQTTAIVSIKLADCAGYVLAEDIIADMDIPAFDRSMMDGFAVRSKDTNTASIERPATLKVVEEIPAGAVPLKQVQAGEAARIMTGAMIPRGADAVCRFEATKDGFQTEVTVAAILIPIKRGDNIFQQGEDIRNGTVVLTKGIRIGAAELAVLATFGCSMVQVYRKPVAAILSSGTELLEVHEQMAPGKTRNSNALMVAELIREAGGIPLILKPVGDNVTLLSKEIAAALDQVDLLVTTGGVSVGDYDLMPQVYEQLGATTLFWKVLLRPGSPFRYAMKGAMPFFGISGNPAASFVNTQLFVLPALRKMSGQSEAASLPNMCQASLSLPHNSPFTAVKQTRFLRATAYLEAGQLHVSMAEGQSSGMIASLIGSNCFIRLDGGQTLENNKHFPILLFDKVQCR